MNASTVLLASGGASGPPTRLTGDALLRPLQGHFCNLYDPDDYVIYNPNLSTVFYRDQPRFQSWLDTIAAAGGNWVFPNVPEGTGLTYNSPEMNPKDVWQEPGDFWANPSMLIEVLEAILSTPGADGDALRPLVFLDSGNRDPMPRLTARWPRMGEALQKADLDQFLSVAIAFEPEGYTANEISQAAGLAKSCFGRAKIVYHGWPDRLVGSSNPVQPDDPWQGKEAEFYLTHNGQFFDRALYQTRHGYGRGSIYDPAASPANQGDWLDRFNDYVLRIAGGYHGWRKMAMDLFETVAVEFIRRQATPQQAVEIATRAKAVADNPYVPTGPGEDGPWTGGPITIGYGSGLPTTL